jgi:TetR/AcrR family transcriptional regulator, regulator of autoinduction and epiphytic fitness
VTPRPEPWRNEPDGRRQRTLRTKAAILDALIELVGEGVMRPTARQIANRSGVAMRSIGQHFASREQLLAAAAMQLGTRIERGEPVDAALPLAERIPAFVSSRAIFLEASRAFRGASLAFAPESPTVAQVLDAFTKARRADVGRVFAAELAALPPDDRAVLFDAIDLAVSGRMWDGLREELGLSPEASQARIHCTVRALLLR